MKNIYTLLSLFVMSFVFAQTTIYSESFGTPSATTLLTAYTGYQNAAPITYSGTADVRTSTPSDYAGASASGSVFIGAVTTASGTPIKTLIISGINTTNYTGLTLSFGHQKGTNASSNELKVEVSSDGTIWTPLTYTRPTGTGTSVWLVVMPTGTIPATSNLRIRFSNPADSNVGFRIDDVKLTGSSTLAVNNIKKEYFSIYPTVVSNGIICITSENNKTKKITVYDSAARLVISRGTEKEVNVSQLAKGTYVINVEENGIVESKKFIIK
ncbi:T9SS type A sorting domain-containing protein [Epilithonimonas sp. UC225_85]|uniref:T9SS type A sorting domain-containing protein n=1 Tax=Epilithonimonas sp. UC225_85 TaxID=3350167 RepID=UPI0036D34B35